MEVPAKIKELGIEKIIFGPAALKVGKETIPIQLSYKVLQERTAYVLNAIAVHEDLVEALEEIKRNCEPWRKADNMAGRLWEIADRAIEKALSGKAGAMAKESQRVPCPKCGLKVSMPLDWDGRNPDEALCNQCYEAEEQSFGSDAAIPEFSAGEKVLLMNEGPDFYPTNPICTVVEKMVDKKTPCHVCGNLWYGYRGPDYWKNKPSYLLQFETGARGIFPVCRIKKMEG